MGKSAKLMKRFTKNEKEVLKLQKNNISDLTESQIETKDSKKVKKIQSDLKKNNKFHPYERENRALDSKLKKSVEKVKNNNNSKGIEKRILDGRPDYVDLMYGRPKPKNKMN